MKPLSLPLSPEVIRELKMGDPVALSGVMITGRDAAHKWMVETFRQENPPSAGR